MAKRRRAKKVWQREPWEQSQVSGAPEAAPKKKSSGCLKPVLIVSVVVLALFAMCRAKEKERRRQRRQAEEARRLARELRRAKRPPTLPRALPPPLPKKVVLPEKGPHPDYPTPRAAGTEQLFLAEEPERGPRPSPVAVPPKKGFRASVHAHCVVEHGALICGKAVVRAAGSRHWRVFRKGPRPILAEQVSPGGAVLTSYVFEWRSDGKLLRLSELDAHANLAWSRTFEASGLRYGARKRNGENALSACGAMALKLDARGWPEEAGCLQWSGQPMHDLRGVALTQYKRNAQGFVMEEVHLDKSGLPVLDHSGVCRVKLERDREGRVLTQLFLGVHDEPVVRTDNGCAGLRSRYGRRGETLEETCLLLTGEPGPNRFGVTTESYEVDAVGCTVVERYVGPRGEPVTDSARVHALRLQVNGLCERLRKSCLNLLDQPIDCGRFQPAHELYTRDAAGRLLAVRHLKPDGSPGKDDTKEVYEIKYQYDDFGNRIRIACHGDDGAAVECARTGHHAELQTFDEVGRLTEERFVDKSGEPGTNHGTAVRRYRYDAYDHLIETENFGSDGKRREAFGAAIQRRIYDEKHRLFAVILLDAAGKPARYTGCYTGRDCPREAWHAVRLVRDGLGRVLSNQYFDHQGQPVASLACARNRCWRD